MALRADGTAYIKLAADGEVFGAGCLARPATARLSYAGLDVGVGPGPGDWDYRVEYKPG